MPELRQHPLPAQPRCLSSQASGSQGDNQQLLAGVAASASRHRGSSAGGSAASAAGPGNHGRTSAPALAPLLERSEWRSPDGMSAGTAAAARAAGAQELLAGQGRVPAARQQSGAQSMATSMTSQGAGAGASQVTDAGSPDVMLVSALQRLRLLQSRGAALFQQQ